MSVFSRLASVFRSRKLDRDLQDEMRAHLEMRTQDNLDAGMSADESRLDAIRRFGNEALIKEQTRSARMAVWLETVLQDLGFGFRILRRSPAFATVAVLTTALSIGATTTVFALVNSILLRPLPYHRAGRLASLDVFIPAGGFSATPGPDLAAWQEQAKSFEGIAGFRSEAFTLAGTGDPVRVPAARVTANFLPLLGIKLQIGRNFSTEEDQPRGDPVALLTYGFWQERFGADAQAIGQRISLDDARYTVIGVLPPDFHFPDNQVQPDILIPLQLPAFQMSDLSNNFVLLNDSIGRLKPGVPLKTAEAELDHISAQLYGHYSLGYRNFMANRKVRVAGLQEKLVGQSQRPLLIMLAAVGLVLAIGCLNIANLQLARAIERGAEMGVRAALGARRGRLLRQLITENVVLSSTGCGLGLLMALWLVPLFRATGSLPLPHVAAVRVDLWVLGFAVLAAIASALSFGLLPAVWISKNHPTQETLRAAKVSAGRKHHRFRNVLVASELALALVLLAGAGLLVRSYARLTRVDLGFNFHNVLTARMDLSKRYTTPERQEAFVRQLLEQLQTSPGVESAAICNSLPLAPWLFTATVQRENQPRTPGGMAPTALVQGVSASYFRTFQIPVIQGRSFNETDSSTSPPVAVVNQTFAQKFFPGEDIIGKRIQVAPKNTWISIVGLVGDDRHSGLAGAVSPEVFTPYQQPVLANMSTAIAIRSQTDSGDLTRALRHAVSGIDGNQAIYDVTTMEQRLAVTLAERKLEMLVLLCFAGMALALATVGVYGVTSYSVAQRVHEIGIRMALGADQSKILRFIMTETGALALVGIVLGLTGSLGLTRYMSALLFEVRARDPLTMVSVSVLLVVVAALAGYLPARRASRVDPMIVLRHE
jgi:predicted permease